MRKWLSRGLHAWTQHFPRVPDWLKALRVRHINLFFAMAFSLVGAVAIAIFAAWVLAPWLNIGTQTTPPADLTKISLTVAAGVGGVVALVVAYRRQRDLEQGRYIEGFSAAAKQLGDADVAVRLAGVYAMAGVADQSSKRKRQQCIDVLCGYLRLPYSPELGSNHQSALILKKPMSRRSSFEEELRFQYRQNDKEVRQTIVRVMVAHLQKTATRSWSSNDFDLAGAHLEEPDFGGVSFCGKSTSFNGATFGGKTTSFNGAKFSGKSTSFNGAKFSGESTSFNGAKFSGRSVSFDLANFSGGSTSFSGANFSGRIISFDGATFSGKSTSFGEAIFRGHSASFVEATFSGEDIRFVAVSFSAKYTAFSDATFSGSGTWFGGAGFSGEQTSFNRVILSGAHISFRGSIFTGAHISFEGATLSGALISFEWATFNGGDTSFEGVDFGKGRVTFASPKVWNPAPVFSWDPGRYSMISKPPNVEPEVWPPDEKALV